MQEQLNMTKKGVSFSYRDYYLPNIQNLSNNRIFELTMQQFAKIAVIVSGMKIFINCIKKNKSWMSQK
jgi:hypothetical protein